MSIVDKTQVASIYKKRFCKTCYIFRPPLSSHCRHCDQCVTNFDHHCFLVNTCIGRRNMRNFVLFTQLIFVMCALYVWSYLTVIREHQLLRDPKNYQANKSMINTLDSLTFVVMVLSEILIPKIRPVAAFYGLGYMFYQATLMYGTSLSFEMVYQFFYVCSCFGVGTSFLYVKEYLTLTYLGFTKKELRSVEYELERKVKCVDLVRGFTNMYRFYILNSNDRQRGASELLKEFDMNDV